MSLTQHQSLVVHADSSVTLRAAERTRIKARFAGKGHSLAKKRNAGSRPLSSSRRAAAHASWAVLQSLERVLPFPADCALPTTRVLRLRVTELSAWTTRRPAAGLRSADGSRLSAAQQGELPAVGAANAGMTGRFVTACIRGQWSPADSWLAGSGPAPDGRRRRGHPSPFSYRLVPEP